MFDPSLLLVIMELAGKAKVAVRVPDVVTGEFVTVKADGRESPTDVTVPLFCERHVPLIAKHPLLKLKPTFDVEVAEAAMERPARVVVPNPSVETESNSLVVEPTANPVRSPACVSIPTLALGVVVPPIPTSPLPVMRSLVAVDEPTTNSGTPEPRALGLTESCPHGVVVPIPTLPRK